MRMTPKEIDEQMWKALDEVSDETGELELNEHWLLRYEGWSSSCFPTRLPENFFVNYATRQSPKIHKEWNAEMNQRGYKAIELGHDENLGLYGVTYALYQRRTK